jgi:hypothetical protein
LNPNIEFDFARVSPFELRDCLPAWHETASLAAGRTLNFGGIHPLTERSGLTEHVPASDRVLPADASINRNRMFQINVGKLSSSETRII